MSSGTVQWCTESIFSIQHPITDKQDKLKTYVTGQPDKLFTESKSSHISNITITYSHPNDEYYDNYRWWWWYDEDRSNQVYGSILKGSDMILLGLCAIEFHSNLEIYLNEKTAFKEMFFNASKDEPHLE